MKIKILVVMLLAMLLSGCDIQAEEDIYRKTNNYSMSIWVDEETGVEYIVCSFYSGAGITPRLNSDGTVMVEEVENER